MNVLVPDIKYHPTKPAACTQREQATSGRVEANYDSRTFRDVGDVWAHAGGQRQFFTMPWTTTPNDPAELWAVAVRRATNERTGADTQAVAAAEWIALISSSELAATQAQTHGACA